MTSAISREWRGVTVAVSVLLMLAIRWGITVHSVRFVLPTMGSTAYVSIQCRRWTFTSALERDILVSLNRLTLVADTHHPLSEISRLKATMPSKTVGASPQLQRILVASGQAKREFGSVSFDAYADALSGAEIERVLRQYHIDHYAVHVGKFEVVSHGLHYFWRKKR